ncbi:MAG: cobalt-precorrin 5A hydrolase [Negativicutes bacterium]|nr:cobalt-precorrin 5A hydrolase [Negativicutes bacterium]
MRLAVISVTINGALLADKLAQTLDAHIDLFAKAGRCQGGSAQSYDSLSRLIASIYHVYDGLVFIMATGIVVRVIAPHIRDKRFDPAVVVMDEIGENAISLLSGHIGGANELAKNIGRAIGARPVITTATDVLNKPAADILAIKLSLEIEPFEQLKSVNAAIANHEKVSFFIDKTLANHEHYFQQAEDMGVELLEMERLAQVDEYDAAVVITDKDLYMVKPHVFLRPGTLAIGLGCRKGTTSAEIYTALDDACRKIGRSKRSIAVIGTTVAKEEEIGLLAVVQQMMMPMEVFTNEQLQDCIDKFKLETSDFVKEQIGVGNICEPAALLGGQAEEFLLRKTVYKKVTIAIAEVKYRWWE